MVQAMRRHVGVIAALVATGLFIATLQLASGYSLNSLYFGVILLSFWSPSRTLPFKLALLTTTFIVIDTFTRTPNGPFSAVLFSRTVMTSTMWVTAALVRKYGEIAAVRLAAEEALSRSLKNLQNANHALDQSTIVVTTDVAGTITYVNDKFCEISRFARAELVGRHHRLIKSVLPSPGLSEAIAETGRQARVWRGELHLLAKDGSEHWIDATIVPVFDDQGQPTQFTVISYDITERKRTEAVVREQASFAQLGKMAAVVAHEVRNPIAGIRGALQILDRRLPASSQEQRVVRESVARLDALNDIVQDLLLFASPRPPRLEPVPLASIFDDVLLLLRADPRFAHVDVKVDIGTAVVEADREQLKQVLLNLMLNSAQAMHGLGVIHVFGRSRATLEELHIADQGPGIATDARDKLFEPFFTTKHRGTGLGLATARRVIEAHGGTIELTAPATGGAVATITLRGATPVSVGVTGERAPAPRATTPVGLDV